MHLESSGGAGYVYSADTMELVEMAAESTRRTGCAPLFLLSHAVTHDSLSDVKALALHLYNKGITDGNNVYTISLLNLLSSGKSVKDMFRQIQQEVKHIDGVVYLDDVYRFFYDKRNAIELLDAVIQLYQIPKLRSPLVLKAPPPSDSQLFATLGRLRQHCFHLGPVRMNDTDIRQTAAAGAPHSPPRPQQDSIPPKQMPPRQNADPSVYQREPTPVYQQSPAAHQPEVSTPQQRMDKEFHGLRKFLMSRNFQFELSKPVTMTYTRRFQIQLQLQFRELGRCTLVIVYDYGFPTKEQYSAAVAIKGYDLQQMQRRLYGVNAVFDKELGGHLFTPHTNPRIAQEFGEAAALVEGMIRAMM